MGQEQNLSQSCDCEAFSVGSVKWSSQGDLQPDTKHTHARNKVSLQIFNQADRKGSVRKHFSVGYKQFLTVWKQQHGNDCVQHAVWAKPKQEATKRLKRSTVTQQLTCETPPPIVIIIVPFSYLFSDTMQIHLNAARFQTMDQINDGKTF